MDFTLEAAAAAVAEATQEVVGRLAPDWTDKFDADGFDRAAWEAFTGAGLTVLALPEALGGDDLPLDALAPLATSAGRAAAVTPLVGTLAATAWLGQHPAAAERVATEEGWYAVAVAERGQALGAPSRITLRADGDASVLTGVKTGVAFAEGAAALLVVTADGVVLVDPQAAGVTLTKTPTSSGAAEFTVTFDEVAVTADDVHDGAELLAADYRALLAAYSAGLLAGAMAMTAEHVTVREQFGKPIAAFQAVGQQLADIYVVSRTLDLIATSVAWRLSNELDAAADLATADYWVAAELPSALRTMTHLHGGIGVDITYPLHRYFSLAKDLARVVGGSTGALDVLADVTVEEAACS
ncbi:acyl-CoA/acyl-ACP dehydrogenase [Gordonia alkaliphila]|uniref:acyl-CoA dehydrogenase family protein n=1 Tax=Gordonia alkaliphila TaxID=1053547 RepID=UPI001FF0EC6C|nr:acyl-CoA dehydrogenase family protein [Gordonia alkaliphila]MCK0439529.1 acyl-CoA/acyl-ACP dehydrogenase [Gordonia alkaliphila]